MEITENQAYLKGMEQLLTNGKNTQAVTEDYILPEVKRPQQFSPSTPHALPIIDLNLVEGPSRSTLVANIAKACEDYGFFQVKFTLHSKVLCFFQQKQLMF